MNQLKSIILLLATITIIVVIHEFGHYITAQLFGVQTPIFSVGFGPPLVQLKLQDTTFQIAALPLGGYVSMNMAQLGQLAYWQKMIIILMGIINNLLLAFAALAILFLINRNLPTAIIARVVPRSPAQKAGLQSGDRIIALNNEPIKDPEKIMHTIQRSPGKELSIAAERNNEAENFSVRLGTRPLIGTTIGFLGIELAQDPDHHVSLSTTIKNAWRATINFIKANGAIIAQLFRSKQSGEPIDFSLFATKKIQTGFGFFLFFIAFTSIQIGLFNLLPIPMLDGGQAFHYTLQAITAGRFTTEQISWLHYAILLLMIMIILFIKRKKPR